MPKFPVSAAAIAAFLASLILAPFVHMFHGSTASTVTALVNSAVLAVVTYLVNKLGLAKYLQAVARKNAAK